MRQCRITNWTAAGLLSLLAGCAAVPPPIAEPSGAPPEASATVATPPPAPSLAKRFLERLHKPHSPPEVVAPAATAAAPADSEVDEKYRLTGEDALELERGRASWYGPRFHGRLTANGERYDKYALTAAHKTLPFGTIVRVRSLALGHEVDVRINDRGPFTPGRVIDVSEAAAEALGLTSAGVMQVSLNVAESTLRSVGTASARKGQQRRGKGNGSQRGAKAKPGRHSPPARHP